MYRILAFVFILSAHVANAVEIRGLVKLATKPEACVQVAYESMTSDDRIYSMLGLNLDTEAASKSSDFSAPRFQARASSCSNPASRSLQKALLWVIPCNSHLPTVKHHRNAKSN